MIIDQAHAMLALIQPLTGNRATGAVSVQATSGTVMVPRNAHCVPVIGGHLRPDQLYKTGKNDADKAGWTVASTAPVSIPILSVLGGAHQNLPTGTVLRWLPTIPGIPETCTVAAPGVTGGARNGTFIGLEEAKIYEQVSANATGEDVFKAGLSRFPGALFVWESSEPDDGQHMRPIGPSAARLGQQAQLFRDTWDLFVVVSRLDSDPMRREQGLAIMDELKATMIDRQEVDGMMFSTLRGLQISDCHRFVAKGTHYVYLIRFGIASALSKRETRQFSPWLRTRIDDGLRDTRVVEDNRLNMPQ